MVPRAGSGASGGVAMRRAEQRGDRDRQRGKDLGRAAVLRQDREARRTPSISGRVAAAGEPIVEAGKGCLRGRRRGRAAICVAAQPVAGKPFPKQPDGALVVNSATSSSIVWPRTQRMPAAPSLWLSTVSAATIPSRPLSVADAARLYSAASACWLAAEPGGGDGLRKPLDFVRRQFDQRRPDDRRRRQAADQRQHLLHAVVHVEERRRVECLGHRIDAIADLPGRGEVIGRTASNNATCRSAMTLPAPDKSPPQPMHQRHNSQALCVVSTVTGRGSD